ncbi:MAG: hypothetical protein ACI4GD_01440 [Lachnospiraceae bacterium]
MILILLAILFINIFVKDAYLGLIALSVRETFVLPEEYLVLGVLYCLFTYYFVARMDAVMKEHYFCRIKSRQTYIYTQIILINVCTVILWMTNLGAGSDKWLIRFVFLFISCNLQLLLKILFSPMVSVIVMISQLALSMFVDYHIFPGDIAMECRHENVYISVVFYLMLIICMWCVAVKKLREMDVINL